MAESAWAFYRGAAAVMAGDLASRPDTGLTVQLCGDAHVLNFGLWATPERQLSFDLRDFDETLPGPFEWDVSRLVASIVVLARDNGVKPDRPNERSPKCLRAYRERIAALRAGQAAGRLVRPGHGRSPDRAVQARRPRAARVAHHPQVEAAHERRRGAQADRAGRWNAPYHRGSADTVRLPDDELALEDAIFAAHRASLPEYRRRLLDRFSLVDAVRQVVGVGSVGMRVFLVLLTGRDASDPLFLQIKQAGASVYEPYCGDERPRQPWGARGRR